MDLAANVLGIVGQIYDSVERPELWPAAIEAIAEALDSSVTGFSIIDTFGHADKVGAISGVDEAAQRRYEDYYCKINLHTSWVSTPLAPGTVVNSREWGIDEEVFRSEYFNDFLRPLNCFHTAAAIVAREDSCMAAFTCYRPMSAAQFGDESIPILKMLVPHLQRAVRLNQCFSALRTGIEDFEDLATGTIVVDRTGRILRLNRRALQIINQNDGLILRREGFELAAVWQDALLKKLIAECLATSSSKGIGPGGVLAVQRTSGRRAYHLVVSPIRFIPLVVGSREPAAILFLSDPEEAPQLPQKVLAELYGLTAAEARLCNLLLKGRDLTDACESLHVSRNTGRAHLRSIFDKVGVKSQSQLVAQLARGFTHPQRTSGVTRAQI